MKSISFNDVANLSAYLDDQLSQAGKTRLEKQLTEKQGLVDILFDMQEAQQLLRQTPRRRAPRNFSLTPRMAGLKPPVPRLVPAFSWASAVAMVLFVLTLGSNLVGKLSFGAAAAMEAAPPGYGMGGGPPAAEGPYPETAVEDSNMELTPTPEMMLMTQPEATTAPAEERAMEPAEDTATKTPASYSTWLVIWPAMAVLLVGGAVLLRWISIRRFRRKNREMN
jgi:hypothetical protein